MLPEGGSEKDDQQFKGLGNASVLESGSASSHSVATYFDDIIEL